MPEVGVISTHAPEFITAYGGPMAWCRVFAQNQQWSTNNPWKAAIDADKRGERVALSYKLASSFSSAAQGSEDGRATGIANGLKAAGIRNGLICIEHEPENPSKGINPVEWRAVQKRLLPLFRNILGPFGWRTSICLMAWTADPRSGRNVEDWHAPEAEVIGWDPYNNKGEKDAAGSYYAVPGRADANPDVLYGQCLTVGNRWGITNTIFETGCPREQADTQGTKRTAWWKRVADQKSLEGFEFVCHFEMGPADGKADYQIRQEPSSIAEFKRAMLILKPSDPCAELEQQVALLTQQVADLTGENAELTTRNSDLTRANEALQKQIDDAAAILTA